MAPKLPLNDEPPTLTLDTNIIQPDNLGGISIFKPETVEQDNKQEIVKPVEDLFSTDDGWDNDFNSWEDQDPNFEDIQLWGEFLVVENIFIEGYKLCKFEFFQFF